MALKRCIYLIFLCCLPASSTLDAQIIRECAIALHVLGNAQDAGNPQIGNPDDPAWTVPALRRYASSLGLVDRRTGRRFLFDATPDIREQLHSLDVALPRAANRPVVDGVFLTHAHIGHYAGLMFFGHESIGSDNVPIYAMPRMVAFLETNGPWSQLTSLNNISLQELAEREPRVVAEDISVTPYLVPHRDEYSETVGFVVHTAGRSFLYLPDIDSWDRWEQEHGLGIERVIATIDYAFIDATFFDDNELPGRDMSGFPHPRIASMIDRFSALPSAERAKIRFIHFNHSNPARYPGSMARQAITNAGLSVAEQGAIFCLED